MRELYWSKRSFSGRRGISCDLSCRNAVYARGGSPHGEKAMPIIDIRAGDRVELKKKHPCGSVLFTVVRSGSDVRIICDGCGRDMTLPREKMEKAVKRLIRQAMEEKD